MEFEVFTKRMARVRSKPYVTIQKQGIVAFNHAAYAALGEPKAIMFMFDRGNKVIGIDSRPLIRRRSTHSRFGTTPRERATWFPARCSRGTTASRPRWLAVGSVEWAMTAC
jgi:predicted amidohydrolase